MICGIVGEGLGDRGLCTAATRPSSTFPCFLLRQNLKVVVSPAKPQLSSTTNLLPLICTHPGHVGMGFVQTNLKWGSLELSTSIRFPFLESSSAPKSCWRHPCAWPPHHYKQNRPAPQGRLIFQILRWIFCTFLPKRHFAHYPSITFTKLSHWEREKKLDT